MRRAPPDEIDVALGQLWEHAAASIPQWLRCISCRGWRSFTAWRRASRVTTRAAQHLPDQPRFLRSARGPARHLRRHDDVRPVQRFDQHRAGIRAAGSVLKRGRELLSGPVLHLQRIGRADAVGSSRNWPSLSKTQDSSSKEVIEGFRSRWRKWFHWLQRPASSAFPTVKACRAGRDSAAATDLHSNRAIQTRRNRFSGSPR